MLKMLPGRSGSSGDEPRAPALPLSAAFVALVNTVMACVIAFGLELTPGQQAAITSTANSFVLFLVAASHAYRAYKSQLDKYERWSHLNGREDA